MERCTSALSHRRDFEVLVRLGKGFAVPDVARRLHLSVKTVSTLPDRRLEKLHFTSNADIMEYVHRFDIMAAVPDLAA